MVNKLAVLYDVTGIQDYIFSSVRLKENIGASIAVQNVLEKFLKDSIKLVSTNTETNWDKYPEIKIREQDLDAEIVYSGGGNAMVIFKNKDLYKNVNRRLSIKILEETGGDINVVSAGVDTNLSDFKQDRRNLAKQITENKFKRIHSFPLQGIAITREGETDGLPAQVCNVVNNRHEYISFPANKKREFEKKESFESKIPLTEDWQYPKEFDDLGQKEGENHIAVVHIDGNNMGSKLKKINSYDDMKAFSMKINQAYKKAMQDVIEKLIAACKDGDFSHRLKLKDADKGKYFLPLRVIVLNGDDVTFVTDGRIGIPLAEAFLNYINGKTIRLGGLEISLSACAGVAVVKSHFPFYRAYQLAEELCASAKQKGKILEKQNRNGDEAKEIGSWLDFHIAYSGVTTDLNLLRKRLYNVPGMDKAKSHEFKEPGALSGQEKECYNLLWRPWCIGGDCDSKYRWQQLKTRILIPFQNTGEWPRSRLKKLRNESIKSSADIDVLIEEMKSREKKLPEFAGESEYFREDDRQTPYFDALELLDFYIDIQQQGGQS
jgi:CRISPR/Cas system-associated protein Cas10 (large subunit of type III CRISPR-Cas system)